MQFAALFTFIVSIVEWFFSKIAARLSVNLALLLAYIASVVVLFLVFWAALASLILALKVFIPSEYLLLVTVFIPSNLVACISVVISARMVHFSLVWAIKFRELSLDVSFMR